MRRFDPRTRIRYVALERPFRDRLFDKTANPLFHTLWQDTAQVLRSKLAVVSPKRGLLQHLERRRG